MLYVRTVHILIISHTLILNLKVERANILQNEWMRKETSSTFHYPLNKDLKNWRLLLDFRKWI